MKGEPKYNALPSGYYNKTFFIDRFADYLNAKSIHVELMESLEEKRQALALATTDVRKEAVALARACKVEEHTFGERKNVYMGFLASTQPIDADAYLAKKHALLDEKLALLEEWRMEQVEQAFVGV